MIADGNRHVRVTVPVEVAELLEELACEERQRAKCGNRARARIVERAIKYLYDADPPIAELRRRRREIAERSNRQTDWHAT